LLSCGENMGKKSSGAGGVSVPLEDRIGEWGKGKKKRDGEGGNQVEENSVAVKKKG